MRRSGAGPVLREKTVPVLALALTEESDAELTVPVTVGGGGAVEEQANSSALERTRDEALIKERMGTSAPRVTWRTFEER